MSLKNYMEEMSKKKPSVWSRVLNSEPFQLPFLCLLLIYPRFNYYSIILDIKYFSKKRQHPPKLIASLTPR